MAAIAANMKANFFIKISPWDSSSVSAQKMANACVSVKQKFMNGRSRWNFDLQGRNIMFTRSARIGSAEHTA
jgi:hypothetical protein